MTVLVDTGPLVAYLNKDDPLHGQARRRVERVLTGEWGLPLSTDFVLDEGLTLLRRRPGRVALSQAFADYFLGSTDRRPAVQLRTTTPTLLREAVRIHFERYDRALSFTDATLVAHVQETRGVLASFDRGFDGLVPRAE